MFLTVSAIKKISMLTHRSQTVSTNGPPDSNTTVTIIRPKRGPIDSEKDSHHKLRLDKQMFSFAKVFPCAKTF